MVFHFTVKKIKVFKATVGLESGLSPNNHGLWYQVQYLKDTNMQSHVYVCEYFHYFRILYIVFKHTSPIL